MNIPFKALWATTIATTVLTAAEPIPRATASSAAPAWPSGALSRAQCLELALTWNATLRKGRQDIAESHGVALQQKATTLPRLATTGAYNRIDEGKIERVAFAPGAPSVAFANNQSWNVTLVASQPLFAGGKLRSAARASRLTVQAALANYQALVASTLLDVRVAYDDTLLASEQIQVQEASLTLLERELSDARRRFEAGTVPRFNVLRAEVEVANAKPRLIRARNALRNARNQLAVQLGFTIPPGTDRDIPLATADKLVAVRGEVPLADAIVRALGQRPELAALQATEKLRGEDVVQARADRYPQLSAVAGYGWQSRVFNRDLTADLNGWNAGAQMSWNVWDLGLTQGKIDAARARLERAGIDVADTRRRVELEVRTAHSSHTEALEVLDSQARVIEQAEEALRLATARAEAGAGTQLDVLSAQTALTEARTTYTVALRDLSVARARLDRAMGEGVSVETPR